MKRHQPKYHVTLFWDLEMDVHRTSKIVTGLVELARRSEVAIAAPHRSVCQRDGKTARRGICMVG